MRTGGRNWMGTAHPDTPLRWRSFSWPSRSSRIGDPGLMMYAMSNTMPGVDSRTFVTRGAPGAHVMAWTNGTTIGVTQLVLEGVPPGHPARDPCAGGWKERDDEREDRESVPHELPSDGGAEHTHARSFGTIL
jgi:hypothetical protein